MHTQQLRVVPPARLEGRVLQNADGLWTASVVVWDDGRQAPVEVDRGSPMTYVGACHDLAVMIEYQADLTF